jgi:hypothetical protein
VVSGYGHGRKEAASARQPRLRCFNLQSPRTECPKYPALNPNRHMHIATPVLFQCLSYFQLGMVHDFHDLLLAISQANFLLPGRLLYNMNPQLQLRPSELSKTYSPDERHARSENDLPHEKRSQRLISFAAWGENDRMQLVRLGLLLNSIQLRVMRERSGTYVDAYLRSLGTAYKGSSFCNASPVQ